MFDNPGKKIKIYAERLFSANFIIAVIWLIRYVISEIGYWELESFKELGKIVIYVCSAYLLSLFLTAFGELVENSGKWKHTEEKEETPEEALVEPKSILTAREKSDLEELEKSKIYLDAKILFEAKDYKKAKILLETIRGYKNADEILHECEMKLENSLFGKIKNKL